MTDRFVSLTEKNFDRLWVKRSSFLYGEGFNDWPYILTSYQACCVSLYWIRWVWRLGKGTIGLTSANCEVEQVGGIELSVSDFGFCQRCLSKTACASPPHGIHSSGRKASSHCLAVAGAYLISSFLRNREAGGWIFKRKRCKDCEVHSTFIFD